MPVKHLPSEAVARGELNTRRGILLEHQERVVKEKQELDDKLSKLRQFVAGLTFVGLPNDEQVRLIRQMQFMTEYSNVLAERITAFQD